MLVRGPFSVAWGNNTILDVSELTFNYDVATNDYETVQGKTYTVEGAITASVELTLLASDVAALSTIFPQYYKEEGEPMSDGTTAPAGGAIDIVAAQCDTTNTKYPLDITSCNGEVLRLRDARTVLSGIEIQDNSIRTVTVTFRGEPDGTAGPIVLFGQSTES